MKERTCPRCGQVFKLTPQRRGQPFANFCSPTCIQQHKLTLGQLHASRLESGFAERLRDAGLAFVEQFALGPYVIDIAFPQVRLLVEIDGEAYHTSVRAQERDDRKDAMAVAEGWRIVRLPQGMIEQHPEE
ncbi:endonuclease domain-containing protein [Deinococcus koreensis]|uniref:DUF559 domain-containing protein n=1 Tax=Deinococcus koreensis TaxID=2054903 RepID=A0A2K3V1U1_9DEIO|nr:DUF559 domain-containing protein [Deinococcus koreensis]PNY82748.1 hypothetical protein CVO96_16550 [Deinococcus koreensis]